MATDATIALDQQGQTIMTVPSTRLLISISDQQLCLLQGDERLLFPVSTAAAGAGQCEGSWQTPTGQHQISACIGAGTPRNAVFVGRRATGEIYDDQLAAEHPQRDWILTRILWLVGCEPGFNQGHNDAGVCVDSQQRYIYLHGTPDTEPMGVPQSHGCIRMRNGDVVEVFERVVEGSEVWIAEQPLTQMLGQIAS